MRRAGVTIAASLFLAACARTPPVWLATSPDLRTPVKITALGTRACVTVADRHDGCFDGVSIHDIAFSRGGGHVAYPVRIGEQWAVVRDSTVGAAWDGIGAPVLAADGSRLAYPALAGRSWRVVADEQPGAPFDAILDGSITFDASGRHLAYAARLGASVHVVADESVGRGWDAVARLTFSGNGTQVGYVAREGAQSMLVVNGHIGPAHDAIGAFALGDDGRSAYAIRDSAGWHVVERTIRSAPFSEVRALAFAPGTGALSFVARTGGLEAVFLAGAPPSRWHHAVEAPVFSASGRRWGYVARGPDSAEVYIDGALVRREEDAGDLAIGTDGVRYAYVARNGDATAVVDERGRHALELVIDGTLQFIAGGSRWVCVAGDPRRRKLFVVIDAIPTSQRVDWLELVRLIHRPGAEDALRAWVAAAGMLALKEAGEAP